MSERHRQRLVPTIIACFVGMLAIQRAGAEPDLLPPDPYSVYFDGDKVDYTFAASDAIAIKDCIDNSGVPEDAEDLGDPDMIKLKTCTRPINPIGVSSTPGVVRFKFAASDTFAAQECKDAGGTISSDKANQVCTLPIPKSNGAAANN